MLHWERGPVEKAKAIKSQEGYCLVRRDKKICEKQMVYLVKGISPSRNYYFETRKVKYINRKFVIYQGERYGNYIRHYQK